MQGHFDSSVVIGQNKNGVRAIVRQCANKSTQRRCRDRIAAIGDTIESRRNRTAFQFLFSDIHATRASIASH